jgi:hypothetical protein
MQQNRKLKNIEILREKFNQQLISYRYSEGTIKLLYANFWLG